MSNPKICGEIVRDAFERLYALERGPTTLTALDVDGQPYVEIMRDRYFHSPGAASVGLLEALAQLHFSVAAAKGQTRLRAVRWRIEPEIAQVEGVRWPDGTPVEVWRCYARLTLT